VRFKLMLVFEMGKLNLGIYTKLLYKSVEFLALKPLRELRGEKSREELILAQRPCVFLTRYSLCGKIC